MSYIGRGTDKISNIEILDNITFDGSSSYSITKSSVAFVPNSAQSLLISIDGVVQATNFSVSTSTIDFGVAVPSTSTCDFFLHYGTGVLFTPADGTVTEAKIGSNAVTSAKLSYPLTTFSSTGIDDNATSTAITIDSSQNVGIGTASPTNFGAGFKTLEVKNASGDAIELVAGTGVIAQTIASNSNSLVYMGSRSNNSLIITTNDTERIRIDTSGNLLVGKTEQSSNVVGAELTEDGRVLGVRNAGVCATFSRLTNDGVIVDLRQANIVEGTISVSGTTVSYNGFTGTHWSRFTDNSTPTILKGTVLETLDEMCDWYNLHFDISTTTQDEDGNDITNTHTEIIPHVLLDSQSVGDVITYNHEGTDYQATIVKETDIKHMKSKVSDTVDAKNVYGVFVAYDNDGEGYNDFYVASVGSFVVRIKANETISKGNLLQSNGDGTAKVQTDDNVKSSSFAKVLSTTVIETYDDGSFIVPCSLMC
jgi:hypothetical protein